VKGSTAGRSTRNTFRSKREGSAVGLLGRKQRCQCYGEGKKGRRNHPWRVCVGTSNTTRAYVWGSGTIRKLRRKPAKGAEKRNAPVLEKKTPSQDENRGETKINKPSLLRRQGSPQQRPRVTWNLSNLRRLVREGRGAGSWGICKKNTTLPHCRGEEKGQISSGREYAEGCLPAGSFLEGTDWRVVVQQEKLLCGPFNEKKE